MAAPPAQWRLGVLPRLSIIAEEQPMAVPKKKTSKAKGRSRRASAWTLRHPARSLCARCGEAKRPHHVCGNCGWYAERQTVDVD